MSVKAPPDRILYYVWDDLVGFLSSLAAATPPPGLYATSWWRDSETNRRVGGHARSSHLVGLAVDVAGDASALQWFSARCEEQGLIVVPYSTHIHLQALPAQGAYARFPYLFA